MKVKPVLFCTILLAASIMLGACATMERGSRDTFIVYTSPIAASVTTDMPIENPSGEIPSGEIPSGKNPSGENPASNNQKDKYFGCAPTPCAINMPRKYGFSVLITKDGYRPQSYAVESLRYKELVKRNAQAVVGTTISAGAISGASIITLDAILAGAGGVTTGTAATAIAMAALPVAALGGMSMAVDAGSGANLDFYPNPMSIKLVEHTTPEEKKATAQFIDDFDAKRRAQTPYQLTQRKRSQP